MVKGVHGIKKVENHWYNVFARIHWQRHTVVHSSLCVISGKTSQHKPLCSDKFWSFKIPWAVIKAQKKLWACMETCVFNECSGYGYTCGYWNLQTCSYATCDV